MSSDYGDVHREHMKMDLEHQDKEWRRLNIQEPRHVDKWSLLAMMIGCLFAGTLLWIVLNWMEGLFR